MQVSRRVSAAKDRVAVFVATESLPSKEDMKQLQRDLKLLVNTVNSYEKLKLFTEEEWDDIEGDMVKAMKELEDLRKIVQLLE